jgi:hypothetical protein
MGKMYYRDGMVRKWHRRWSSPISSFCPVKLDPKTIDQTTMHLERPVVGYEKLLSNLLFCIFIVLGLLSIIGVKWHTWVGVTGLIVTISFFVIETLLFHLRSFSRDVKLVRSIILLRIMLIVLYFIGITTKGS